MLACHQINDCAATVKRRVLSSNALRFAPPHPARRSMTFLHTHCEELSAEQQLEGVRALCRHLDIVPAACRDKPEFGPSFCFTILTGIAKVSMQVQCKEWLRFSAECCQPCARSAGGVAGGKKLAWKLAATPRQVLPPTTQQLLACASSNAHATPSLAAAAGVSGQPARPPAAACRRL